MSISDQNRATIEAILPDHGDQSVMRLYPEPLNRLMDAARAEGAAKQIVRIISADAVEALEAIEESGEDETPLGRYKEGFQQGRMWGAEEALGLREGSADRDGGDGVPVHSLSVQATDKPLQAEGAPAAEGASRQWDDQRKMFVYPDPALSPPAAEGKEDTRADELQEVVAALYKAWPDAEDIPSDWPLGIIGCIEQIVSERDEALAAWKVCQQSLNEQAEARRDPTMPVLVPEVIDAWASEAEASYAMAETPEERRNAHGLSLLVEWQRRALSHAPAAEPVGGDGWVYYSPDVGTEYAPNHPVKSGETPDATNIRPSTLFEDFLVREAAVNRPTQQPVEISREDVVILLVEAFEAGCFAVHENYQPDPDPEFAEAARDYAMSAISKLSGYPLVEEKQQVAAGVEASGDGSLPVPPEPLRSAGGET